MPNESISLPKTVFARLALHDGDIVEGRAGAETVEIRVVRRREPLMRPVTGTQFVDKWRARFSDVQEGTNPRLDALLRKHVKPS